MRLTLYSTLLSTIIGMTIPDADIAGWQKEHFGQKELSLTRCIASLTTANPLIDVRCVQGRWLVRDGIDVYTRY